MSGIAGVIDFSGAPIPENLIDGMLASMAHRGQDGTGRWISGSVALGHCMTHATPESLTETQPLVSTDGRRVLVMDGRLDNWEDLRRDLAMPGANDAELVMAAFEAWGEDYPSRLEGDYAIAIWDPHYQRLHAARDLFGKRPFYYHWDGRRLAFASEQGAIFTLPWICQTLNEGMLAEWLAFDWYSLNETFWAGVYRLKPRHQARFDTHGIKERSSWEPDIHGTVSCRNDKEFTEHYRAMLRDIVRRLSRSHRPLAFEMSGGLDSSAVYAVGRNLYTRGQLLAPGMQGYVLSFPPGTPADEVEYARAVGRHCGTTIHECQPSYRSLDWYRDAAIARCDFPGYPNGIMQLGMYETAKAAGAGVVMGGYGGDEWTGQGVHGQYYAEFISAQNWSCLARALREDIGSLGFRQAISWLFRYGIIPLAPKWLKEMVPRRSGPSDRENRAWLSPELLDVFRARKTESSRGTPTTLRFSQRVFWRWLENAETAVMVELQEYHLSRLGMEVRSPYQTKPMVEFAFATDERLRHRGTRDRWIHREAMAGLIPAAVCERRSKADFMVAIQTANNEVRTAALDEIEARRGSWLTLSRFDAMARTTMDVEDAGLEEWVLWTVACCDAVVPGVRN